MQKIAIIMPCFYSNNTIRKAFEHMKMQTKRENIVLYMVNDCSPNTDCEYQDIIKEYSQYFEIKYFKTEDNLGPGVARQIALDNCHEKYIIFHDDDDYFQNEYGIENCLKLIQEYKDEKIAAIGFSYMVEFDDRQKPIYLLADGSHWNNQNILYNKEFFDSHNIKMNTRTSYSNEDMQFHFLVPFYAELEDYQIIYKTNIFLKVIHHDKNNTSITYTDESNKKERRRILQKQYMFYTIEKAEFIKMYKNIVSKYRKLTLSEYMEILRILKSFYKYSNSILSLLENNDYFPFKEKEVRIFKESCDFYLEMIDKNYQKVTTMIKKDEETEWEIHYTPIMFENFRETYEDRCAALIKKCQ